MHHPVYRYLMMFKMQKCKLFVAFCSDFCCAGKLIIVEHFFLNLFHLVMWTIWLVDIKVASMLYIYMYKYVYMCIWVMIILRDKITLLFQKWRYRCCLLHNKNLEYFFFPFIYWQEFCSVSVKHFPCGRKEMVTILYPPRFLGTNKHKHCSCTAFVF